MACKRFDKNTSNTNKGTGINSENKELAEELHKPVLRNFENKKHTPLLWTIFEVLVR